ncbi:methylated-DNA--[protein]-cysteine S-methyltransferase [candidate division KSB1 bacterium]|nr:methylated-DNA--[protein]-cysteine S-methyltransferase [candidate division KSB1 bacterium]
MTTFHTDYQSPIGIIEILGTENAITHLLFVNESPSTSKSIPMVLNWMKSQLDEYFAGQRKKFDIPILTQGTSFQERVWQELLNIPYGVCVSYGEIAQRIGHKNATRAVGYANHLNKLPIIIPCHRVIGKNKKPVGYAGGIWRKEWLLAHEQRFI